MRRPIGLPGTVHPVAVESWNLEVLDALYWRVDIPVLRLALCQCGI